MLSKHVKDLTGYRSGWLEVLKHVEGSGGPNRHARWLCYCHRCGNYTEVESGHLTSSWRPVLSCGCLRTNPINTTLEDLKGQTFGLLTVVDLAERGRKNRHAKWNCLCVCGNKTVVDSGDLKKGNIISCGCKAMSKGEIAVDKVLRAMNIEYTTQYPLYELTTKAGGTPRMDFAVFDSTITPVAFIEYQGKQHYKDGDWGKQAREETDPMKKDFCKRCNVPLFEIKYTDNPTQETMKILEILKLIPCQALKREGVSTIQ